MRPKGEPVVKNQVCELPQCNNPVLGRGMCCPHYKRWLRHGDPLAGGPPRCHGGPTERLGKFVLRGTDAECWTWTGHKNNRGYGMLSGRGINGKRSPILAHRLAWELHNGRKVPGGMFVLHSCDNPACCNPAHLSIGDQSENITQMWSRGRR